MHVIHVYKQMEYFRRKKKHSPKEKKNKKQKPNNNKKLQKTKGLVMEFITHRFMFIRWTTE